MNQVAVIVVGVAGRPCACIQRRLQPVGRVKGAADAGCFGAYGFGVGDHVAGGVVGVAVSGGDGPAVVGGRQPVQRVVVVGDDGGGQLFLARALGRRLDGGRRLGLDGCRLGGSYRLRSRFGRVGEGGSF